MEKKMQKVKTTNYFTQGRTLNASYLRDVATEPNPYKFPSEAKDFSYRITHKKWKEQKRQGDLSRKYYDRPTFRSRQNEDVLERLHIPPDFHEKQIKTMIDIDPEFYSIIQGRPIKDKFVLKDYINSMKEILRTKLAAGVRNDVILQIDEKIIEEKNKIEELKKRNKAYVDAFETFLAQDHADSMEILKKSQESTNNLQMKDEECKQLQRKLGITRTRVYALEEKWKKLKLYQQFLYEVSPPAWRREHDPNYQEEMSEETAVVIESNETGPQIPFDTAIKLFTDTLAAEGKPELYFTDPQQLLKVLQDMEVQNLNLLIQSETLSKSVREMKCNLKEAKRRLDEEEKYISDEIEELQKVIEFEEERDKFIKEYSEKLLSGTYRDLAVSDEALSLHVYVRDTYETCVSNEENNLGMLEMMKAIERKYETLMLQLDALPVDIVQAVKTEVHKEEARKMKEANIAMEEAKRMERLIRTVKKNMEPPPETIMRPLRFRSYIKGQRKKKEVKKVELTQKEKDYLTFFTDFCHHTDNADDYLQKISSH